MVQEKRMVNPGNDQESDFGSPNVSNVAGVYARYLEAFNHYLDLVALTLDDCFPAVENPIRLLMGSKRNRLIILRISLQEIVRLITSD